MRIRTSDNKEQQIEELTYGKEYKENNAKRISRHNIERVNYQLKFPTLCEWPKYLIFNLSHITLPPQALLTLLP